MDVDGCIYVADIRLMAFISEACGAQYDERDCTESVAESRLILATLSAILIDLSESYYAIVHGAGGCLGGLLRVGELDLVVQEALAAYERQVLRRDVSFPADDVSEWVGLLSRRVDGRVRLHRGLLTDLNDADWRQSTSYGIIYIFGYVYTTHWRLYFMAPYDELPPPLQ